MIIYSVLESNLGDLDIETERKYVHGYLESNLEDLDIDTE